MQIDKVQTAGGMETSLTSQWVLYASNIFFILNSKAFKSAQAEENQAEKIYQ